MRRDKDHAAAPDSITLLVDSPLFDDDFYRVIVGDDTLTREDAARHYVSVGVKHRLPLNPLHLPRRVLDRVWVAAGDGDIAKLLWWMRTPEGQLSMMPLVEVRDASDGTEDERAIGYTADLDPLTLVRVGDSRPMQWSEYLATIVPPLTLLAPGVPARPNRSRDWDEAAERDFLEQRGQLCDGAGDDPLVSVVMPTWNREQLVAAAIHSVLRQTYPRWELIVVDDGSTDSTREVVRELAQSDARIQLVERPHAGVSPARNDGIARAKGSLVAFLDSDNEWRSDYLSLMVSALRDAPDVDAVFGAIRAERGDGSVAYIGRPFTPDELLVRNFVDLNALVARTDAVRAVGGFSTEFKRWVDYDLVLRLADRATIAYVPVIACDYAADDESDRISTTEPHGWFSRVIEKPLAAKIARTIPDRNIQSADVSIVLASSNVSKSLRDLQRLRSTFTDRNVEFIVALSDLSVGDFMSFIAGSHCLDGVVAIPLQGRYSHPLMVNLAVHHASAPTLVVAFDCQTLHEDVGRHLLGALEETGAAAIQPLLSYEDGTLISAGREWLDGYPVPVRFLAGLSPDDHGADSVRSVSALDAGMFVVRTDDWRAVGGFDVLFADVAATMDFSLRLANATGQPLMVDGRCRVGGVVPRRDVSQSTAEAETREFIARHPAPAPAATDAWRQLGWEVRAVELRDDSTLIAKPVLRRAPALADDGREALRWALKIGARFTAGGERWGDVPFANDLAQSLRDFGHNAVVDRFHAERRRSASPDDVILTLRGRRPVAPVPGRVNLLWIISRPDYISIRELNGYDGVFVASNAWARVLAERADVPVSPLLQAANVRRFLWPEPRLPESGKALFVGGARKPTGRQVVADALRAGLPLEVWGPGWRDYVPESAIGGEYLPNELLPQKDAEASVVLSDHFSDMARRGFVNNRVFEALATGARVISDPVSGMHDVFGDMVATYDSVDELRALFDDRESRFGDSAAAQERAAFIAEHHSFDARARQLVRYVRSLS